MKWYKLGLRREFSVHRRKTIESFNFVRADISSLNLNLETIKNIAALLEAKISAVEAETAGLRSMLDKCISDINMQRSGNSVVLSKIESINKSIENASAKVSSFRDKIDSLASGSSRTSDSVSKNNASINKMLPRLRKQSALGRKNASVLKHVFEEISKSKKRDLKARKRISLLKEAPDQIKKLRNLVNRRVGSLKRINLELEKKVKTQRKTITSLNHKIEGKKVNLRKITEKRIDKKSQKAKKTIKKVITPRKKITKTITPRKTVTKTETPKTIVEVIKQHKPLI